MKALVIGPSQVGEMCWFVRVALERRGADVVVFDDRAYLTRLPGTLGRAVQIAQTRTRRGPLYAALQSAALKAAQGCDLILTVKGENLAPETVGLMSRVAPTVNWYSDHPFIEQNFSAVDAYTLFCPKDTWTTDRMTALGFRNVRHLPHAGDPLLMRSRLPESYDIGMMGSDYPYRATHVRRVCAAGLSLQVYGSEISGLPSNVSQHRERVMGQAYADAMSSSRIVLNTHAPRDVAGGNQRLLDSAAAGKCQLTEPLADSVALFPGGGLTLFDDLDDLQVKATELLQDDDLRRHLGILALEQVRESHTYEHRIATVLDWLG